MTKVAILIDGGYFLKRLPTVRPDIDAGDPEDAARSIQQLLWSHLNQLNRTYGTWDRVRKDGIGEFQENRDQSRVEPVSTSVSLLLLRCTAL